MEKISVNNGTTFSQSPQVYKFITECPDYLSSNGNDFSCGNSSNSNHCDSDNEFDSHGGGGGGIGVGSNDVHMTMNLPEVSSPTPTASLSFIHPSPSTGSKRRLVVSSNTDDTITASTNNTTPLVFTQQSSDEHHYLSGEKLTRGKQKIPIEFISERTKRYSTFSKRKTGLMKKAVELAELTGAEVLLLVASETNHVYTFATQRLKGIIELECGKKLIQTCLSSSSGNSANLSMMKTHCQDLNINTTTNTNDSIRSQNVNESDSGCKKERNTTINTTTTTDNSVSSIDTAKHKDPVESTHISGRNTTVIPNSSLDGDDNDGGSLLQISNLNPNDISQDSSQMDCSSVSLEHGIITDDNNNNDNNSSNDNTPQMTYITNPSETNHQMVYVPVSIFPNPLTPLSSNILLTTAQMTAMAATASSPPSTNNNTIPHQLLLLPQFNTLPTYSVPSNPVVFNSTLSTLNQLNMNLVNFLNVNRDIHNTNTIINNNNISNGPVEMSTNSTTLPPPPPSLPLTTVTTRSNDVISEINQYKKEPM
uniref:MADS-box domain-containing protein n=1 Tax=Trichobilharzia regenti TaxID=157069 RepID=A0AA85K1R2_TRIRE|nr:unnamed protein product [Trichobilharzia regenti]